MVLRQSTAVARRVSGVLAAFEQGVADGPCLDADRERARQGAQVKPTQISREPETASRR